MPNLNKNAALVTFLMLGGCQGAVWANLLVMAASVALFVFTLRLGKAATLSTERATFGDKSEK